MSELDGKITDDEIAYCNTDADMLAQAFREAFASHPEDVVFPNYGDCDMEEYSERAIKFWQGGFKGDPNRIDTDIHMPMMIQAVMGLTGESGEAEEIIKKYLFQGHDIDYTHLAKELGDVCWYLNLGARALGLDIGDLMNLNLKKLGARYPEGHFTERRSINRKEGDL